MKSMVQAQKKTMHCIQWYKRKGWKKIEDRFVDTFLEKVEDDDSEQKHVEATE